MEIKETLFDENITYDDIYLSEIEDKILSYVNKDDILNYDKILEEDTNVYVQNALSSRDLNMFTWYPFSKGSSALLITSNYGSYAKYLEEIGINVTCVEITKKRAEIVKARCKNCNNLNLILTSNILDLKFDEKFDYVIMMGVLENSKVLLNNKKDSNYDCASKLFCFAKDNLSENGKILIATNNKFGIKYFAGAKEYNEEKSFDNIVGRKDICFDRTFSKNEILSMLEENELKSYKFYYPLPDYKCASVIYTDDFLPSCSFSKLKYNIYYNNFDTIVFDETEAMKTISKSSYFDIFANSYFIEIGKDLCTSKFISFNNMRNKSLRLVTKIEDSVVEKRSLSDDSNLHIEHIKSNIEKLNMLKINTVDSYLDDVIYSKYTKSSTLDEIISNNLINGSREEFLNKIEKWYKYIIEKLKKSEKEPLKSNMFTKYGIDVDKEILTKLNFTENGFLDLIFENIFLVNDEYVAYDQEWFEENVPFEYILYRAIISIYFHNRKLNDIYKMSEVFEYFGISQFISLFEKLENAWQKGIVDQSVINFFQSTYSATTTLEALKDNYNLEEGYRKEIWDLKDELSRKNQELEFIKSSRYFPIFEKFLRRK